MTADTAAAAAALVPTGLGAAVLRSRTKKIKLGENAAAAVARSSGVDKHRSLKPTTSAAARKPYNGTKKMIQRFDAAAFEEGIKKYPIDEKFCKSVTVFEVKMPTRHRRPSCWAPQILKCACLSKNSKNIRGGKRLQTY